ncbi:MAG: hypothetical protein KGN01_06595 [Patescibacteria group bacterium]|nr:hypothetical protein [Patescibacteria group bacterium]
MPKTIIKIATWRCPDCDYSQDFDPLNRDLMNIHHGFPENFCPACYTGKNTTKKVGHVEMIKETNPDKKTTITIMGEDELETHEIEDGKGGKRTLTTQEKEEYTKKIRSDIEKFKALED